MICCKSLEEAVKKQDRFCFVELKKKGVIWGDKKYYNYSVEFNNYYLNFPINYIWLKFIYNNNYELTTSFYGNFLTNNDENLKCIKFIHKCGIKLPILLTYLAAANDNLDLLKYVYENEKKFHRDTCYIAIVKNSIRCLEYAYENGCSWNNDTICNNCYQRSLFRSNSDSYKLLQYTFERGGILNVGISYRIAYNNDLNGLKFLKQHNCQFDQLTIIESLKKTNLICFNYLLNNGCEIPLDIINYLSDLDEIKKYYNMGYAISSIALNNAIKNKNIDLIKFLLDNKCPYDDFCFKNTYNDFILLELLLTYKIKFNKEIYYENLFDINIIKILYENNIEYPTNILNYAICVAPLNVIKYIHQNIQKTMIKLELNTINFWLINQHDDIFHMIRFLYDNNIIIMTVELLNMIYNEYIKFNNSLIICTDYKFFDFIKYIHKNINIWDINNKLDLYNDYNVNILEFIITNNLINPKFINIKYSNNLYLTEYAYKNGCNFDELNNMYDMESIKFLYKKGYKFEKNIMKNNFYTNREIIDFIYSENLTLDFTYIKYFKYKRQKEIIGFLSTFKYPNSSTYILNILDNDTIYKLFIEKLLIIQPTQDE